MCLDLKIWKNVLEKPEETFKKQEKKASLGEGVKHIGIAGIVAGIIIGILAWLGIYTTGNTIGALKLLSMGIGPVAFISSVILVPIILIVTWLIGSGILYIFAKIFNGKGSYTAQSYLIAIYSAPLIIISAILALIPVIGMVTNVMISLYSVILLTLSLKQCHRVSISKASLIWMIPVWIVMIILVLVALWIASFVPAYYAQSLSGTVPRI